MQVYGIKGASVFLLHPAFNMAKGFVIDDLHAIYLGVTLRLLSYWFGKQHSRQDYSIRSKVIFCAPHVVKYVIQYLANHVIGLLCLHIHVYTCMCIYIYSLFFGYLDSTL